MPADAPTLLALDFDGVLCDGMLEYFETSWRTYCQIWQPQTPTPTTSLRDRFQILRPVIEVGWEMPLLLRAIVLEIPEEKIWQDWSKVAQEIILSEQLNAAEIGSKLDQIRDQWIAKDRPSWLALHRFYPGVVERLQQLQTQKSSFAIVTTKEGRFTDELLQQQGIRLAQEQIIGKESRRSKPQTLREFVQASPEQAANIWFVEDRLKTLQAVQQQPDLGCVRLYLADWGYNTPQARAAVRLEERIQLLSLSQFVQDFSGWS